MRGKQQLTDGIVGRGGLIPACAGKTTKNDGRISPSRAHPRVCGENVSFRVSGAIGQGSSPRVRGKPGERRFNGGGCGLIPACAGKTQANCDAIRATWAHPRVCGENHLTQSSAQSSLGSSPRVRGKPTRGALGIISLGLIPACAGKTSRVRRGGPQTRAHPRVCGENTMRTLLRSMLSGSSPRVRGKRRLRVSNRTAPGLIPACAGKTRPGASPVPGIRAHPRVCGENPRSLERPRKARGSSPRVRGKRVVQSIRRDRPGLIPACAGKTVQAMPGVLEARAHPRVCGENPIR